MLSEVKNTLMIHRCRSVCDHLDLNIITNQNVIRLFNALSSVHNSICPNGFGFESCFSTDEKNVDFLFYLDSLSLKVFGEHFQFKDFISTFKNEFFVDFFNESMRNNYLEENNIRGIWIGFDLRSSSVWPPIPNLYLSFKEWKKDTTETIEDAFHRLAQKKMPAEKVSLLHQFFSGDFGIYSVGFMLARSLESLRICTRNETLLPTDSYIAWLNAIGLEGAHESFGSLLDQLRQYLDSITFDLDAGNQIHEKFGVSCYVSKKVSRSDRQFLWRCILDILHSKCLVRKEKQEALLKWCGLQPDWHTYCEWPNFLRPPGYVLRDIGHIKIVFSAQKPVQVKAYFGGMI